MKPASGPEATIITPTAKTTAITMIGNSLVIPTAVMMLSTEKTMSMRTIWTKADADAEPGAFRRALVRLVRIDLLVNLRRRLPHEKEPARQQEQVAHGKRVSEHGRYRSGEVHDRRGGGQHRQAEDEREPEAEAARERPPARFDPVREQRDEDEIVDAEHDFHGDQGRQRRPGGGIGGEARDCVHASLRSVARSTPPTAGVDEGLVIEHAPRLFQRIQFAVTIVQGQLSLSNNLAPHGERAQPNGSSDTGREQDEQSRVDRIAAVSIAGHDIIVSGAWGDCDIGKP